MIRVKVGLAIALALVEIISCIELAKAHFSSSEQVIAQQQTPPVGPGIPNPRKPIVTRGPCPKTDIPFTPLLPLTNSRFSEFTLAEYPTLWFYIPYKRDSISSGSFSLEDKEKNLIYQAKLNLPETPGFVSISLPQTIKPLEKNQEYRWHFRLSCQSPDPNEPAAVWHEGLIKRVDMPILEEELNTVKSLQERIKLYQDNNIWYDVSTDLNQIHDHPQIWQNLLTGMGVEWLKQEPISGSAVSVEN